MEKKKIPSRTRILIALVLGGIFLIGGFFVSFIEPWGNTPKEIQQFEDAIGKINFNKVPSFEEIIHGESIWERIEEITNPLVYENERVAKAKALIHFENSPVSPHSLDYNLWENRFDISKQDWKIQSFSSRILTSTGIGFGIFFAITIIAYIMLAFVPWLWYFLLDRVSELSQAVRGK